MKIDVFDALGMLEKLEYLFLATFLEFQLIHPSYLIVTARRQNRIPLPPLHRVESGVL